MAKISLDEWLARAKEKYGNKFIYHTDTYIDADSKITITCPEHGDFKQSLRGHLRTKCGCPKCGYKSFGDKVRKTTELFISEAVKIHGNKYNYSEVIYVNNETPIKIYCNKHLEYFIQRPSDHLQGKGCPKCGNEKISKKLLLNTEEFIKRAKKTHGNKYDYSKSIYKGYNDKIKIICPIHGEFELIVNNHLAGKGCKKCALEYSRKVQAKTTEQFIKEAKEIHGDKYDYSKVNYINAKTPVTIICPIHGEFQQQPDVHLRGGGCLKCLYKNQELLYEKLKNSFPNDIIIYEADNKVVSWLILQRFDIYFSKYNIAIEYNGKQHYIPVEHFGGELGFESTLKRDELKRQKCKENNCVLFEVKYDYTEEDYNNLVLEILKIINKN